MKKVIFGGSFNPVHQGHINNLQTILKKLNVDRGIIVPTLQSPLKSYITDVSPSQRMEMLHIAFDHRKDIEFSDFEISKEGLSYTIDTLRHFVTKSPDEEFYLAVGIDQILQFHEWRSFGEILGLANIVVASRPGYEWQGLESLPAELQELVVDFDENKLELSTGKSIFFVQLEDMDVSSTEVRKRIEDGLSLEDYVSPEVGKYIEENQLYKITNDKVEDYEEFAHFCGQVLFDKKGINVRGFDVRDINQPAEFNLVTSGTSTRHAMSLAENLIQAVREKYNLKPQGVEGMSEGRWIVIDYGSLIIHVFYDYLREAYRMEELWKEGKDLKLKDKAI